MSCWSSTVRSNDRFCREHMAQLRQDYDKFIARNTEVVVVGPEGADAFRAYWQKEELPFVGLPDPQHRVLKLYGQQIRIFKLGRMPAQVLIDKQGVARFGPLWHEHERHPVKMKNYLR